MVRLVIKEMTACHVGRLYVIFALIIGVSERSSPKRLVDPREERLDPGVFPLSCTPQAGEILIQNPIEWRGRAFSALEQSHPPSVTQQNVIQQSMNASEGARTLFPVLGIV
jgi:hypothetical protein